MKHYSKLLHLFILVLLYTQVYSHDADPSGLLSKYSLYGKEFFTIKGKAKFPPGGWLGTDGNFNQTEWDPVVCSTTVKVKGDFEKGMGAKSFDPTIEVFVEGAINGSASEPTDAQIINPTVVDVPNFPNFGAANITTGTDSHINKTVNLPEGRYNDITVGEIGNNTVTFGAGVYEINNLTIGAAGSGKGLVVDKAESKTTRILVKGDLTLTNKGVRSIISTTVADDYGTILIFVAGNVSIANEIDFNASIVAPNADVVIGTGVGIYGQIMAKSITLLDGFDGGDGEFHPFINSNIEIVTDFVHEDPRYTQSSPDPNFDPQSGFRNIEIMLKNKLDVKTAIAYEIVEISPIASATGGVDFNVVTEDSLRFDTTSLSPINAPQVYIHDDDIHDIDETLVFRFKGESNPPDKIIFEKEEDREKVIRIEDDDPKNTTPENITLDPAEVKEEQPVGTPVGNILVSDKEDNVSTVEVANSVPFSVKETISATDTTYQLVTDDVFDFEQGPRSYSVDIKATDQGNADTTITFTVKILPINDSTCKATIATFDVSELDSIIGENLHPYLTDGDSVASENRFTHVPAKGPFNYSRFELKNDGTFDYVPDASLEVAKDSFCYTVKDYAAYDATENESDTAWVLLTIKPEIDNTPITDTFNVELFEGEAVTVKDLFTDADSPNDSHTIKAWGKSTAEESITVHGVDSIVYLTSQTATTEIFWDSVFYEVKDDTGLVDTGLIVLNIKPLNDNSPVAATDSVEVTIGRTTTIDLLLANDTDADKPEDQHTIQLADAPTALVSTLDGGSATTLADKRKVTLFYDPNKVTDDTVDYIEYEIEDPTQYDPNNTINNATGTLKVFVVLPDSTKPIANDDFITLDENDVANTLVSGETSVMINDQVSATLSGLDYVTLDEGADFGTVTLEKDGTFTYDHDNDEEEFFDSFTYILVDSAGKTSLPATVHITIDTLNDNAPTIVGEEIECDENGTVSVNVIANDSDLDIFTQFVVTPAALQPGLTDGTISLVDSILTYTNSGTEGEIVDTVFLEIQDSTSYDQDAIRTRIDTVIITINPINDETPVGGDKAYTLLEGETLTIGDSLLGLLGDATDPDLIVGNELTSTMITPPSFGGTNFDINANGTFTYVHDDSENFFDSLVFEISDGIQKNRYTARFSITPVNDNDPVAANDTFPAIEGATITPIESILLNDSDVDMYLKGTEKIPGQLATTFLLASEPYHGIATMTTDGFVTYTHDGSESTIDSMQYLLTDNNAGVTRLDTATIYFTIPQSAPQIDSSFYFDDNGDGIVERVEIFFNDSLFLSETNLQLLWEDGTTPDITDKVHSSNGQQVTLAVSGSPELTTSGKLSLTVTHSNKFASESETVTVSDRAAPVIDHAVYFHNTSSEDSDSITVYFSEAIGDFTDAPYLYLDRITLSNYTITHRFQSSAEKSITYEVLDKSVKYVHNDDSIRVVSPNIVSDNLGNLQDSTIWAPIIFRGTYDFNVDLFIVPQPMKFEKVGSRTLAKEIDVNLLEYYSFPTSAEKRGVAFILTASLPLGAPEQQVGYYTIFDAVGNIIAPKQAMSFARDEENRLNGLATWSGNNLQDRSVGNSAYFCLVEVVLTTVDGQVMEPITIKRPIGVAE